jgi:hypothetical protein
LGCEVSVWFEVSYEKMFGFQNKLAGSRCQFSPFYSLRTYSISGVGFIAYFAPKIFEMVAICAKNGNLIE